MSLPATLPEKFDASVPLADVRYERFAQLRVMGVPKIEAAWESGFRKEGTEDKPILPGNAARLDRHPEIVARKVHLASDDAVVVAETRLMIRDRLLSAVNLDMIADFAIIRVTVIDGKRVPQIVGFDWVKLKKSGLSAAITKIKCDPSTGAIEFDRDDPLQALSQLRDMYGYRAPRRKELSGPGGRPMQVEDVTGYTDDELLQLQAIQTAVEARRSVAQPDQGGD